MMPKGKFLWVAAALFLAGGAGAVRLALSHSGVAQALESPGNIRAGDTAPDCGGGLAAQLAGAGGDLEDKPTRDGRWATGFKAGGRAWWFERIRPMWRPPEVWRQIKDGRAEGR